MKHPVAMPQVLWLLLTPALVISSHLALHPASAAADAASGVAPSPVSLPGCPRKCGDVEIPYPFGIGDDCVLPGMDEFIITCNQSFSGPKPYSGNLEVINITVEAGEMHVVSPVSYICYNSYNTTEPERAAWQFELARPFLISKRRNMFTAIGCFTVAFLEGRDDSSYSTGCITTCGSLNDAAQDGDECTGLGCCQVLGVPGNLSTIKVGWGNTTGSVNPAWKFSPCSYAFVAERKWYHFNRTDLTRDGNMSFISRVESTTIPLVLDWAITNNGSCQMAPEASGVSAKPIRAPACVSENSECVNATQGLGYLCNCSAGYEGNPYVVGGCTNINECALRKKNPAIYEELYPCGSGSTCHDTQGGYNCRCKFGHIGDGKSVKGCRPIFPGYATAIVVTFVAIFVLVLLLYFLLKEHKRRVRRGFFDKNGGEILKRMNIKIFTEVELEKMTNHFMNEIGKGHFSKVFMGTTNDKQRIAVKRPILQGNKPREGGEFVGEITFQFKIRHKNLVRLIGCCLETNVPSLVFEFIPNGSLNNALHGASKPHMPSLTKRLDIAIGSAEALSYMHSHGDHNHVHCDIKSANILLDGDLMPKVSDFGSAKLLSIDRCARSVAADRSYIDPVYMKTDRFTEKSDVYSFGVVLLELITRKTAKYDGNNSLPINFVKSCKEEGNGRSMYDKEILSDDAQSHRYIECLDRIGALAVRCLKEDVDERPTMAEVAEDLKQVKSIACGGPYSEAS